MIYVMVVIMTWLGALGAFFLKRSARDLCAFWPVLKKTQFYLGIGFYGAGALLNIVLLRHMEYSVLYPMGAMTYIWSLLSVWRLRERITKRKILGLFLVCMGVLFLAK